MAGARIGGDNADMGKLFSALAALVAPPPSAAARLEADVRHLADDIGERNFLRPGSLDRACAYLAGELARAGWETKTEEYDAGGGERGRNVSVVLAKKRAPVLVVGAHYDSAYATPGADDNASGCAALLELARRLKGQDLPLELRLVFFGTEEPPRFGTQHMGSAVYAAGLKAEGREVAGMISLEMLGYFRDAAGTQEYPDPLMTQLYGDKGDFVAAVANPASRAFGERVAAAYGSAGTRLVSAALPEEMTGVSLSDQWSFWREGFAGIMLTDTAFLRNPHYHARTDMPETLDYKRLAGVVDGLEKAVLRLTS